MVCQANVCLLDHTNTETKTHFVQMDVMGCASRLSHFDVFLTGNLLTFWSPRAKNDSQHTHTLGTLMKSK